jgi:hypothetical protein
MPRDDPVPFVCECDQPNCAKAILLRLDEYEQTVKPPTSSSLVQATKIRPSRASSLAETATSSCPNLNSDDVSGETITPPPNGVSGATVLDPAPLNGSASAQTSRRLPAGTAPCYASGSPLLRNYGVVGTDARPTHSGACATFQPRRCAAKDPRTGRDGWPRGVVCSESVPDVSPIQLIFLLLWALCFVGAYASVRKGVGS